MFIKKLLPGVKLVKEEDGKEITIFISQNDKISVVANGLEYKGEFMVIEFARYTEEDDILHMHKENGENEAIPFDNIEDINKLS